MTKKPGHREIFGQSQFSRRVGVYVLILAIMVAAAAVTSLTYGLKNFGVTSYPVVAARPAFVPAVEPIRAVELGLAANTPLSASPTPSSAVHLILILPGKLLLLQGGQVDRSVAFSGSTISEVVQAVANSSWIALSSSGVVSLNASLVVGHGATLEVSGINSFDMVDHLGVFLGALGGTLDITGVAVSVTGSNTTNYRPFILADDNSVLDVSNSHLTGLGWDWDCSYGLSWMHGSTGDILNSSVNDGFIGVYTDHVKNIAINDDTFDKNSLYGVDPHSDSSGINLNHVNANDNGRHGIIFANNVTSSSVRNSVTEHNGENGIMMYDDSSSNVIEGNLVEDNAGDGVAIASSSNDYIGSNVIKYNRVGIHVTGSSSNTAAVNNRIFDNSVGAQGIALSSSNKVTDRKGLFILSRVTRIWEFAGVLTFVFLIVTLLLRRRRIHRMSRFEPAG